MSGKNLLLGSVIVFSSIFVNMSFAEEEAYDNEYFVARLKSQILEEEDKVKKLKTLLDNYQKGLVDEKKIAALQAQIFAGKNPAQINFYVKSLFGQDYREGTTDILVPVGYRLEADPREGLFFRNCVLDSVSSAEAADCASTVEKMVNEELSTTYNQLKIQCKERGCDDALFNMQDSWNTYRENSYKFMESFTGQSVIQASNGMQKDFWNEELIKQLKVLKNISSFIENEK
ncbi:Protein of unknown function [Succinivibrio dextrinosolvens]|uniref:lysozyme inhibitor LprI family protein n=1 Tax=Succinivibrio dextrinosolvens TaxID=83771 RepID=UPI0008EF0D0A|nr:lysozyme inhibitor LprI family protein [Succinivibrio dextrinosolvens]SFS91573.1 Protein of unknown function [Succinivibrio dextrinosolvens]